MNHDLTDHISDYHCVYVPLCQFHYISRSSHPLQNTADLDILYSILYYSFFINAKCIQNSNCYLNKNNNISFKEIAFLWQCVVVPAIHTNNQHPTTTEAPGAGRGAGTQIITIFQVGFGDTISNIHTTTQSINTKFLTGD